MNRYKATIYLVLIMSVLILSFQGKDFIFTIFKGGNEYNKGTLMLEKRNYLESIDLLKIAINKNPLFSEAHLNLGYAYAKMNNIELAKIELLTAIELFNQGHQIETKDKNDLTKKLSNAYKNLAYLVYQPLIKQSVIKGNPGDVSHYHKLFKEALTLSLEYDPQQKNIQSVIDLCEKNQTNDIADTHYNLAIKNMENDNPRLAVQNLNDALEIQESHVPSLTLLGIIYQNFNELDLAINFFIKSLSFKPAETRILNTLAEIYSQKQDYPKAIEYYLKSLEINSNQSGVMFNIAVFYKETKHYQEAINYWEKYLLLKPNAEDKNEITNIINQLENSLSLNKET